MKSAFLKGERYIDGVRELSLRNVETKDGSPALPTGGRLSKIVKGVFGFSDAPREWYLRLKKSLKREKWSQSAMDAATFFLWSGGERPELLGMMCCHVDDLLFSGSEEAWASVGRLGEELGFGSVEKNDFVYCGKRVAQDLNTGVISVSMEAYVDNLVPIHVAASRRRDMDSALNPGETRQLRGLVGSLQWLVAQVRADMGYHLSVLQAESPTVATMLKANLLVTEFKATKNFMLKFRPMNLEGAGIVVVSDASLGNVTRAGAVGEKPLERVYSQSCYTVSFWPSASWFRAGLESSPSWTTEATVCSEFAGAPLLQNFSAWRRALTSASTVVGTGPRRWGMTWRTKAWIASSTRWPLWWLQMPRTRSTRGTATRPPTGARNPWRSASLGFAGCCPDPMCLFAGRRRATCSSTPGQRICVATT